MIIRTVLVRLAQTVTRLRHDLRGNIMVILAMAMIPLTFAVGFGIVNPLLSSIASDAAGAKSRGTVLGFSQSSSGLARTIGPILGGILFARVGAGAPFAAGACAAGCCVVLGLILRNLRDVPVN